MDNVIITRDLRKSFRAKGGRVEAVRGVSIDVGRGEIFGFLGPNGAGKTTTLRMLTTLLPIDAGTATVAGLDVARQPGAVRSRIGYVSQLGGADELATGRENLILQGRLYGRPLAEVRRRTAEVAELLGLAEFADRRVTTYSGGQRRRLDVALGIVHDPEVLFLDEPSTRARPAEPCQPLGPRPGPPRPGHHRLPDDALPGRGRCALRPADDHRLRPDRRRGRPA